MSKIYSEFEFIGNIAIPKEEKFIEIKDNGKGWIGHRTTFAVKETPLNSAFVELYGGYKTDGTGVVYTFGKGSKDEKGQKLEIAWGDRLKPEVIDMVADFKKIVVDFETDADVKKEYYELLFKIRNIENRENLTDEDQAKLVDYKSQLKEKSVNRHEFISEYDAVLFITNNLPKYKDYKFRIKGSVDFNEWKGKIYRKFNPNYIEIVPEDRENKTRMIVDIFFNKDSIDEADFEEEKKIYLNGYVQSYTRDVKADRYYPQTFVLNASKINMDDEQQVGYLELIKGFMKADGNTYLHLPWDVNVFRGAESLEFGYDDLTDQQKTLVQYGVKNVSDFAPKGGVFGANIEELRLVAPRLNDDFKDGALDTELNDDEFNEKVVKSTADVKLEDVVSAEVPKKDEPVVKKEEPKEDLTTKLNGLFG